MASRPSEYRGNLADFRLEVAGTDITDRARPRLISLTLTEKRGEEADQLDITLDDSDGKLAIPPKRALIRLSLGWARGTDVLVGLVDKGRFTVDEAEWNGPPDQIVIRARSADLTSGFRVRREKSYTDTTLGDVARQIASANGLGARVAPELAQIPVPILAQHETSDMALLRRLGREHDAVATVKDRKLILNPIGRGASPGGRAFAPVTFTPAIGDRYSFKSIDRDADAGVEARWHDQDSGDRKTVKAGGAPGPESGKPRRLRRVYHNEADARAAAQSEAKRTTRAERQFELTLALGRPDLTPERPVTLLGFKSDADAVRWTIAETEHSLGGDGLRSRVTLSG